MLVYHNQNHFKKMHRSAVIVNDIGHNYHFKGLSNNSNTHYTLESGKFALNAFMCN